jgi:hypothetical protein
MLGQDMVITSLLNTPVVAFRFQTLLQVFSQRGAAAM